MRQAERLESLQVAIMQRIAQAAAVRDVLGVRHWGNAAEQCQTLEQEARNLDAQINELQRLLDRDPVAEAQENTSSVSSNTVAASYAKPKARSARAEGAAARTEWVKKLTASGLPLYGNGKRYQTSEGRTVGIAFANELPEYPNKWWLGLPDEATDVAVLLCKQMNGAMLDIALPVSQLGTGWGALSRSNGQIKFNVRRDGSDLLLLIPGGQPISVKRYVGNRAAFHHE